MRLCQCPEEASTILQSGVHCLCLCVCVHPCVPTVWVHATELAQLCERIAIAAWLGETAGKACCAQGIRADLQCSLKRVPGTIVHDTCFAVFVKM